MKIKLTYYESYEYGEIQEMFIDDKFVARSGGGEPEDMIIGRDILSLTTVYALMKRAYDAGKNGEELEYKVEESKP